MVPDDRWFGLLLLVGLVGLGGWLWRRTVAWVVRGRWRGWPRPLRPRTPHDCPGCRAALATPAPSGPPTPAPPWRADARRGGRPKAVPSEGFACPNPTCPYVGVTEAAVHALVGDGHHGRDRIQDFRCQACHTKVSARRDTALYRLTTPAAQVSQVLTALAEGLDQRAAGRVFGHGGHTLARWLHRSGAHGARLHARHFRGLHLPHLQLDELRIRLRDQARVLWLWLAVDPLTKVIPALQLGQRNQAAAHALVHTLGQTLASGCVPAVTSDGLTLYFSALTAHFGRWVAGAGRRARHWQVAPGLLYGQVKKVYRRRRLMRVVPRLRCGSRRAFRTALRGLGLSGHVTTAFVERANLTLRRGVAGLARRTWATAQSAPQLVAQLEWWRAYYHFSRPHRGLRLPLAEPIDRGGCRAPRRSRRRTPAMALGVTDHPWTVVEVLTYPLPPPRAQCA
jgi:IS1 family transposase/transposase-like protein